MLIIIVTIVSVVNIIAKNYNYNINVPRNPDFDIRVRRDLKQFNVLQPRELDERIENSNNDMPLILDILTKRKPYKTDDIATTVKRDTYQQNTQINNGYTSNGNASNGVNGNINYGYFKTNPDFITKTYNKVAKVFGYSVTQSAPKYNSAYTSIKGNNNGYVNQYNGNNYVNNDRFYNPINTTNYFNTLPYAYSQNSSANYVINTNTSAQNRYGNGYGFNTTPTDKTPQATYNYTYSYKTSNTSYYPTYAPYNNYNNTTNMTSNTTNRYNGTSFVPYNGTNINNGTKTTTTEMNIAEGCILCQTFSCPTSQKRVGFKCVDIDYDY